MYKILIFLILINGSITPLLSQEKFNTDKFLEERNNINRNGMYILGGWAIANIISGTVGNYSSSGKTKYFHQFNAVWNTVNLGIAVFGLTGISADPLSLSESFSEFNSLQNLLLLNAGLDVAYIVSGFYLKERSKNAGSKNNLLIGYGNSLIMQGSFLLAFDLVLYFLHKNNSVINLFPLLNFSDTSFLGIQFQIKV